MERLTDAGAIFETRHRGRTTLRYHRHDLPFATIVVDGAYTEVRDTLPHTYARGAIVVRLPGEEHADHFLGDAVCVNVEIPRGAAAGGAVHPDSRLRERAQRLVRSFYRDRLVLPATIAEFQAALRAVPNGEMRRPAWLQPVLDNFAWCDPVPLRDAARMAGVHPVQFSRAFHRHVGMTSNEYRRRSRLQRASALLLVSSASLARIAQHCGFADQSHLTRAFSETLGLSPARYRNVFAR